MKKLIVIEGPTAVGKTDYAINIAKQYGTDIISADSRQFYKELNIGVARPSPEELQVVKHHFIANLNIFDYYSVSKYETDVLILLDILFQHKDVVVLTGGSGLYVNAVCNGIDDLPDPEPELRESLKQQYEKEGLESIRMVLKKLDPLYYTQVDLANAKRILRALEVCLTTGKPFSEQRSNTKKKRDFEIERYTLLRDKEELYWRINQRVDIMMQQGLEEEAKNLYPYKNLNALNTVGYKELFDYFSGKISKEQAVVDIKTHSRRYAKRQITWLKQQQDNILVNL